MKLGSWIMAVALALSVPASTALGDQLIMKDGKDYSGKLVRADANVVEFRIQGKVESFNISDVAQIVFKTPEIVSPPTGRSVSTPTPASIPRVSSSRNPPAERELQSSPAQTAQGTGALPTVTLPAGTPITIRMAEDVDTERNQAGDVFNATLAEPLTLGDQVIAPAGSEIKGDVAYARDSGTFTGQSELILELNELRVGNRTYQLRTSDYSETGPSRGKRTAATIGGAAAGRRGHRRDHRRRKRSRDRSRHGRGCWHRGAGSHKGTEDQSPDGDDAHLQAAIASHDRSALTQAQGFRSALAISTDAPWVLAGGADPVRIAKTLPPI